MYDSIRWRKGVLPCRRGVAAQDRITVLTAVLSSTTSTLPFSGNLTTTQFFLGATSQQSMFFSIQIRRKLIRKRKQKRKRGNLRKGRLKFRHCHAANRKIQDPSVPRWHERSCTSQRSHFGSSLISVFEMMAIHINTRKHEHTARRLSG